MYELNEVKQYIGTGILLGLGWILVAFNTVRALQSDASVYSRIVGIVIPFALAIALFAGAYTMYHYDLGEHSFRIAGWTIFGLGAVMSAVILDILSIPLVQPDFSLALYMIITAAAGGAIFGFLIGMYDAHQRSLVATLRQERDRAQNQSVQLSVLNRVLRHDIRNQIQIIQAYTDQQTDEDIPPAEAAKHIQRATARLESLSDEARKLQSLLTDADPCTTVDLVASIRAAGDVVQHSHPDLTIAYDLPDTQPVYAPPLIEHAIKHLLHNVAEHNDMAEPRAEIIVTVDHSASPPITLTITDNGPGIPDTEPLPSNASEESQLKHSSGLGLWFVNWIVEEADGELTIDTPAVEGKGTVVTLGLSPPPTTQPDS